MRYFCIGDDDTVRGFRLAGIQGQVVSNPVKAQEALHAATGLQDVAILIITEELAHVIKADLELLQESRELPLIVRIPNRRGPSTERQSAGAILQQTIGVRVS